MAKTNDDAAKRVRAMLAAAREQATLGGLIAERQARKETKGRRSFVRPFTDIDEDDIPKRQWVYGRLLIRKFVSVIIAPGGAGKSALTIVDALAMASGKPLLGKRSPHPLNVMLWNLEDSYDELQRRVMAAKRHYKLNADDTAGRLNVESGREVALSVARMVKNAPVLDAETVAWVVDELVQHKIDVLIIDPFISSHSVPENDNTAVDLVVKQWNRIAEAANAAILMVHHTRKSGTDGEVTTDSARGAKALTDAARNVRVINKMTVEEAREAEVPVKDRHLYFRVISDKQNLAPPVEESDWFRLENVVLRNDDHVGVVTPWKWPDTFRDVTVADVLTIQQRVGKQEYRADVRGSPWFGELVGEVLGIDIAEAAKQDRVKRMIHKWIENGVFKVRKVTTSGKNKVGIVEVGTHIDE